MEFNKSVYQELDQHIKDLIEDGTLNLENKENWHYLAFNQDYYIIGYYQAEQWLEEHGISAFHAIDHCTQYEKDHFGESYKRYDNAETTVNMLVYILGEELFAENAEEYERLAVLSEHQNIIVCDRASLLPLDLIDAFFTYSDSVGESPETGTMLREAWVAWWDQALNEYLFYLDDEGLFRLVNWDLFEWMQEIAPSEYHTFGASEGDGSLFGYWIDTE